MFLALQTEEKNDTIRMKKAWIYYNAVLCGLRDCLVEGMYPSLSVSFVKTLQELRSVI